jgi:lipopolysaccharide transport system ATP-binding protein
MSSPVISVENIAKSFQLGAIQRGHTMADAINARLKGLLKGTSAQKAKPETLWALKGVSFEVQHGEVLGIIGRNGAGKSTLLKILSRIVAPTGGRAVIEGRVGSLLEVGTGFSGELSGRENIFLNGTILGMSREEIRRKFDEIVEFSEVGRFIDTPVKRYSSGMYTRLAFAVAAHLDPEILIVDEVLSVGDIQFQKKCLGKMGDMTRAGRTVLFVSHNMAAISSFCTRCIVLKAGEVICDGTPDHAIAKYAETGAPAASGDLRLEKPKKDWPVYVTRMALEADNGTVGGAVEPVSNVSMAMLLSRSGQNVLYSYDVDANEELAGNRAPGRYVARVALPTQQFKEGEYTVELKIGWNRIEITDPLAVLPFEIVNYRHDLMHKSYRADRMGFLALDLDWKTSESP